MARELIIWQVQRRWLVMKVAMVVKNELLIMEDPMIEAVPTQFRILLVTAEEVP